MKNQDKSPETLTAELSAVGCSDLLDNFIKEWMTDTFYWLEGGRITILQQAAFKCGLTWHTGVSNYASDDYPHNNLWFSKDSKMQSLDWWSPNASHGEPKDFDQFLKAWDEVDQLII